MNRRSTFLLNVLLCGIIACGEKGHEQLSASSDYEFAMQSTTDVKKTSLLNDYLFWLNKIKASPDQHPYLLKSSGVAASLFERTGNVVYLNEAEEQLVKANEKTVYKNTAYMRALAKNYITQHQFKKALELLIKAEQIAENLNRTQKMLFDVYLELSELDKALSYLNKIENTSDFDYLIRLSKWHDHNGNLDAAILKLEEAMSIVEKSKNKDLMRWVYTNIADYYGHQGSIQKSYDYYLKALRIDNFDAYALKGIAWIVFSYERQPKEALRILNTVMKLHQSPDYYLLKAEMMEYLESDTAMNTNLVDFDKLVQDDRYGDMYNSHQIPLLVEHPQRLTEAFSLAEKEVNLRPTPQSYQLMAWCHFYNGEKEKALDLIEKFVKNKSHEPLVLYRIAEIYKANGLLEEAGELKAELLDAIYELGPMMENKINAI